MDWFNDYLDSMKNQEKFELSKVEGIVGNTLNKMNELASNKKMSGVLKHGNKLIFANCKIKYSVENGILKFTKLNKDELEIDFVTCNVIDGIIKVIDSNDEEIVEIDTHEQTIEFALQHLLTLNGTTEKVNVRY